MKVIRVSLVLVLALTLLAAAGCKKEPAPTATQAPAAATEKAAVATEKAAVATEKAAVATEKAAVATEKAAAIPAMGFDAGKSLDQVKADVAKMDVKQLTAIATACKEALTAKQVDLAKITEQLKNIPMAEKLGAEAQKLTGEAKTIGDAVSKIQAQLTVYIDKLKELKVDTSALQVK
jgi:hypothetical protein